MSTFRKVLREIREREGLTMREMAARLGIKPGNYNNVESGNSSAKSPTAKRMYYNKGLSHADQRMLRDAVKKETETIRRAKITDEQRLAYRRRKNEQYRKELQLPRKVSNREIKRAIPKTMTQQIFY